MPAQRLNCSFSLLDEGRQYTGNHRKYIIENAREICNSPATKEKIRLREALGFYGHGRRILAGKMNIGEVEAVTLPDGGKAIVSNIPCNVTVAFDVSPEGVVSHSQEVPCRRILMGLPRGRRRQREANQTFRLFGIRLCAQPGVQLEPGLHP